MSDGTIDLGHEEALLSASFSYAPMAERKSAPIFIGLDMHAIAECLPRLGPVLWLYREEKETAFPRARLTARGVLLLEHPALMALANCSAVQARSSVTPRGPREWIDFDANGKTVARMYFLPDTDCLAWDAMLQFVGATVESPRAPAWQAHRVFMRCAWARVQPSWLACVVRLPVLQLPCLQVLGLRAVDNVSALGRNLAFSIADDERARMIDVAG
jgi:hypothetical protein